MPDLGVVPTWSFWVAGSVLLAALVAVAVWLIVGRRVFTRRYLVTLVGRRESVRASRRTLEAVIRHLVDEPDEALMEFADDAFSPDRRALIEVRDQMRLLYDELDTRPMPQRLVRVANELADAAYVIAEEATRITDDMSPEQVLEALATIDLARVVAQLESADEWVDDACEEYRVEDAAVYGGGLYI